MADGRRTTAAAAANGGNHLPPTSSSAPPARRYQEPRRQPMTSKEVRFYFGVFLFGVWIKLLQSSPIRSSWLCCLFDSRCADVEIDQDATLEGYDNVKQAFAELHRKGYEVASAFAAHVDGDLAIDIAAGTIHLNGYGGWIFSGFNIFDELYRNNSDDRYYRHIPMPLLSLGQVLEVVAIGHLVDKGQLNWDDAIADHWPEFAQEHKGAITIEDMLSHRSGFGKGQKIISANDVVMSEDSTDMFFERGFGYDFSFTSSSSSSSMDVMDTARLASLPATQPRGTVAHRSFLTASVMEKVVRCTNVKGQERKRQKGKDKKDKDDNDSKEQETVKPQLQMEKEEKGNTAVNMRPSLCDIVLQIVANVSALDSRKNVKESKPVAIAALNRLDPSICCRVHESTAEEVSDSHISNGSRSKAVQLYGQPWWKRLVYYSPQLLLNSRNSLLDTLVSRRGRLSPNQRLAILDTCPLTELSTWGFSLSIFRLQRAAYHPLPLHEPCYFTAADVTNTLLDGSRKDLAAADAERDEKAVPELVGRLSMGTARSMSAIMQALVVPETTLLSTAQQQWIIEMLPAVKEHGSQKSIVHSRGGLINLDYVLSDEDVERNTTSGSSSSKGKKRQNEEEVVNAFTPGKETEAIAKRSDGAEENLSATVTADDDDVTVVAAMSLPTLLSHCVGWADPGGSVVASCSWNGRQVTFCYLTSQLAVFNWQRFKRLVVALATDLGVYATAPIVVSATEDDG